MEPTNLHRKHTDAKPELSDGFRGHHHPDPNEHLLKSLWAACLGGVGYIVQYVREVRHESHQRALARKSDQSGVARHVCTRDDTRTCCCPDRACADDPGTYRLARGPYLHRVRAPAPNKRGAFRCPVSGLACSAYACRDWCESGVDYSKT